MSESGSVGGKGKTKQQKGKARAKPAQMTDQEELGEYKLRGRASEKRSSSL